MYTEVEHIARTHGLEILAALYPRVSPTKSLDHGTLVLLGTNSEFWPLFKASPESTDGLKDPVDRWSKRVIDTIATQFGARAHYPFGGPPHAPFVSWALDSGRVFSSPTNVMVHDTMGMMISFRGALQFDQEFEIPTPPLASSPCDNCIDKPCTTACPVGAMNAQGNFQVKDCYDYIAQTGECVTKGCLARGACPLSQKSGRNPEQTSHHMSYCKF